MNSKISKPEDLSKYVFERISGAKTSIPNPPLNIINKLLECLFYTSMKSEESSLLKVTVTLIDPSNPDPKPPLRIVADRWQYVKFKEPIPYTIDALVKLSKAADPWSSSLAVYYDAKFNLSIWGMIDQSVHYQSFLNYETESGPEQPGLFQSSITGIGTIVVLFDYELIATLKQNKLVTRYTDVLRLGPVSEFMQKNFSFVKKSIFEDLTDEYSSDAFEWHDWIEHIFRQTLSRILLRIQNYHHGGALLFTFNVVDEIDIKYQTDYNRIPLSIINLVKQTIINYNSSNLIFERMDGGKKTIPVSLYLEENVSENEKKDIYDELKGAIRFIASQTCVDGLVLFNEKFESKGFGAVLKTNELPEKVFISTTAIASNNSLKAVDPNHFGTRHRSMFSYCWKYPKSLGFVISQDGDIRAVTKFNDKLIVWENIKAQQFLRSSKIARPKRLLLKKD